MTFYMFDFNVQSSNDNITSGNITCVGLKTLGPFNTVPQLGGHYNFSGQFVTGQPSNDSVPVGVFLVTAVNTNAPSNQTSDWLGALKGVFDFVSGVGSWLVTFIVQVVGFGGVVLPEYLVAFAVAALASVLVVLRLHWAVTLSAFLVGSAVTSFIIQTYLLLLLGINF